MFRQSARQPYVWHSSGPSAQVWDEVIYIHLFLQPSCSVRFTLSFSNIPSNICVDASTVTTLRREMLEVIRHKFMNMNAIDDLQWPLISTLR